MILDYEHLFSYMVIRPEWEPQIIERAKEIAENKNVYSKVCSSVNKRMPYYFVGILHSLESNLNFNCHLHNGDSLRSRTVNVPTGRPVADSINGRKAAYTWVESAVDALTFKNFDKWHDWDLKSILYRFEAYNGFGYRDYHNMLSPYLWSGTEYYDKGKYDKDGHFNHELVSKQVGAAPLILYLTDKTKDI
jgi:lysozyme family protein